MVRRVERPASRRRVQDATMAVSPPLSVPPADRPRPLFCPPPPPDKILGRPLAVLGGGLPGPPERLRQRGQADGLATLIDAGDVLDGVRPELAGIGPVELGAVPLGPALE